MGNVLFLVVKQTGIASNRMFLLCGALGIICALTYHFRWHDMFVKALRDAESDSDYDEREQ
jgi:hypothetical protein